MVDFSANPLLKERWADGFRTGMLGGGFGSQQQSTQAPDLINQITSSAAYKNASESERNTMLNAGMIQSLNKPQFSLPELGAFREQEARRAQELGKESLGETLKAKLEYDRQTRKAQMIADLPGNVAKAFSGPASIYYAGMSQIPQVYNQAVSQFRPIAITGTNVVSPGSVPNYFS
jgi:hypothetical protein